MVREIQRLEIATGADLKDTEAMTNWEVSFMTLGSAAAVLAPFLAPAIPIR